MWTLHRLFLVELVDRALELFRDGAVLIDRKRMAKLARRARLPEQHLDYVLDCWLAGDNRAPPLLMSPDPNAWTLADAHMAEREFIVQGGARRKMGAQSGEKGRQRKTKRREPKPK